MDLKRDNSHNIRIKPDDVLALLVKQIKTAKLHPRVKEYLMFCPYCPPNPGPDNTCGVCFNGRVGNHDGQPNSGRGEAKAEPGHVEESLPVHVPIQELRELVTRTLSETCRDQS